MGFLFLTSGQNSIWSGKPNKQSGTPDLYRELTADQEITQIASNATTSSSTFTAIAVGDTGGIYRSNRNIDNISNWLKVYQHTVGLNGVAYGSGKWVACGFNNTVLTSADGTNWSVTKGCIPGADWSALSYGNGKFVACGGVDIQGERKGVIMYSEDQGTTWKKGSGAAGQLNDIDYSPTLNKFVAVGYSGTIVSADG